MPKYQIQITSHQGNGVIQILNYKKKKKRKNLQKKMVQIAAARQQI